MRVAIYARFSSDLQDARSITDQVSMARARAEREGWSVAAVYCDAAISGATTHNRPGLLDLMVAAKARAFDAVLTESLDRLSRDLEDIAGIHKRLAYLGIKIVTLADGEVGKLHVGIKGLIANLYLEDLAQKTRRGQTGRVHAGRIPGGRCYGYTLANTADDRGRRAIDAGEADVVRRIFAAYVAGRSPLAIATELNREGIRAPRGGMWNASTINGSRKRANGILSNSLYAGRLTYNRQRFVKDPATGRRQARENPRGEWITADLPDLRIVDDATWTAAQSRRATAGGVHLSHARRPKRLLSGLLRCGVCGGSYIVRTRDFVACSRRTNTGTCDNARDVSMGEIETRVLDALRQHLLAPEAVAIAVEAYRVERRRLAREHARDRAAIEREAGEIDRRIARIVAAIEAGGDAATLVGRLAELERRRREIAGRMPVTDGDAVVLHPQAAERYRQTVAEIHAALTAGDAAGIEAVALVRGLITSITIIPMGRGVPVGIEIAGDLAALLQPQEQAANPVTAMMVAGARNSRCSHRLAPVEFRIAG